jgi:hypothetical protein
VTVSSIHANSTPIDWPEVWSTVADQLREDRLVPQFLTEDGIRVATLRAMDAQIDVNQIAQIEYGASQLGGGKLDRLDLVAHQGTHTTAVEFKFPREPRQTLPPWPDHLGGYLSDTYRLGILANGGRVGQCFQILVSGDGFLGYLRRTVSRLNLGMCMPGEAAPRLVTLTPAVTAGLSPTTRAKLRNREEAWDVTANRVAEFEVSRRSLWLAAYAVTGAAAGPGLS